MSEGWLCPKCGSAHAPTVQTCPVSAFPYNPYNPFYIPYTIPYIPSPIPQYPYYIPEFPNSICSGGSTPGLLQEGLGSSVQIDIFPIGQLMN